MPKNMNLSIRLTEPLSAYVSTRVGSKGDFDNASEYVRDLIRRDRERQEQRALQNLRHTLQEAFAQPDDAAAHMDFASFVKRHEALES